MKSYIKHITFAIGVLLTPIVYSCSDDIEANPIEKIETSNDFKFKSHLRLVAQKPSYEAAKNSRASNDDSWKDGSTIYVQFDNAGKKVLGMATYSQATNLWEVSYASKLELTAKSSCKLFYFDGADDLNAKGASIAATTGIYEDLKGSYVYDGNEISIKAHLVPKLGRIRFSGNENDRIILAGMSRLAYFDAEACTYKLDSTEVLLTANVKDGEYFYTPYYYGVFEDRNEKLKLTDMKDAFARYCSDIFIPGKSGYMKIPHSNDFSGWMKNNPLAQSSVAINWPDSISLDRRVIITNLIDNLVFVEGSDFILGAQTTSSTKSNYNANANIDESPTSKIVVSPFYMSNCEITIEQFKAVMGFVPSSICQTSKQTYPINYHSSSIMSSMALQFVEKMRLITGLNFDIPIETEWEYAAAGGKGSTYHYYAGCANSWNSYYIYQGYSCTSVKTLRPNEIGLYDMSGNVAEICYSIGDYTSKEKVNPRWDHQNFVCRGASAYDFQSLSSNTYCSRYSLSNRTRKAGGNHPNESLYGFRIVLRLIDIQ